MWGEYLLNVAKGISDDCGGGEPIIRNNIHLGGGKEANYRPIYRIEEKTRKQGNPFLE